MKPAFLPKVSSQRWGKKKKKKKLRVDVYNNLGKEKPCAVDNRERMYM